MELLLYLAGRPCQTVSKQELMELVWRANVVDEAVHRAVSLLRSALGDSATNPSILETVPRHGYRLMVRPTVPRTRMVLAAITMTVLALAGIAHFQASISPRGAATTDFASVRPLPKNEPTGRPAVTVPDDPPRSAARRPQTDRRPAQTAATETPVPTAVAEPMIETPAAAPLPPTPQPSAIGSTAAQQPAPLAPVAAEQPPAAAKVR